MTHPLYGGSWVGVGEKIRPRSRGERGQVAIIADCKEEQTTSARRRREKRSAAVERGYMSAMLTYQAEGGHASHAFFAYHLSI
jgi:hypothetical protein